jgi:hypothetical protein
MDVATGMPPTYDVHKPFSQYGAYNGQLLLVLATKSGPARNGAVAVTHLPDGCAMGNWSVHPDATGPLYLPDGHAWASGAMMGCGVGELGSSTDAHTPSQQYGAVDGHVLAMPHRAPLAALESEALTHCPWSLHTGNDVEQPDATGTELAPVVDCAARAMPPGDAPGAEILARLGRAANPGPACARTA